MGIEFFQPHDNETYFLKHFHENLKSVYEQCCVEMHSDNIAHLFFNASCSCHVTRGIRIQTHQLKFRRWYRWENPGRDPTANCSSGFTLRIPNARHDNAFTLWKTTGSGEFRQCLSVSAITIKRTRTFRKTGRESTRLFAYRAKSVKKNVSRIYTKSCCPLLI